MKQSFAREVFIVDGARTPFLKARGLPGPFSAADLAVAAGRELLSRFDFDPNAIDQSILGCVMPRENEANIGRLVGLRLGLGELTPGWTVQRNCASGLQALDSACKDIAIGRSDLVLAGGTEAMSHAPLLFNQAMTRWLAQLSQARRLPQKAAMLFKLRPQFFSPIIALLCGLSDPLAGVNMGQTAEIVAHRFGITRDEMDEFALQSHLRLTKAIDQGYLKSELVTLYDQQGQFHAHDDGLRADTTLEKLATLKPIFDKKFGQVTAGNSSQVTDGAAMLLLASADAVKQHKLPVLGRVIDVQWAALAPEVMGLGPVVAATPLMQRQKLTFDDIDFVEINEAFAAQVLGCLAAWKDDTFCRTHFALDRAFGELDKKKLNVDGGAIAIGHPVGASGARIVLHLLEVLKRENAKRGLAAICIGGGQGGAMLVERV